MKWEEIGKIANRSVNKIEVHPTDNYPLVGIKLWGQGCYKRDTISGFDTQYKYFTVAKFGNLVFNKIWARNGAISVISEGLEGHYISPEFPVYELNKKEVFPKWLLYYTNYNKIWTDCDSSSRGTSGKNRIKPSQFEKIKIPLPPLTEQKRIVKKLDSVQIKINEIKQLRTSQEKELKNLLYSKFVEVSKGAEMAPMAEVAPVIRKKVEIQATIKYPELGVRGFGRGIFHKPLLNGIDLTWQKLYEISKDDIVISNIKAWEGAIAVASEADDKMVASHRYLTCKTDKKRVLPEFVCAYLLYPEGLEKIRRASPGSADRNRTLAVKRLERIKVPVPDIDLQKEFVQLKRQVEHTLSNQQTVTKDLADLMPSLLDKAFKGDL